jgi:hypothetical protein
VAIVAPLFLPPPLRRQVGRKRPRSTQRLAVSSGGSISRASIGQLLFQYTIKGIKKEIATGVKKPDTYGPVAKAEKLLPLEDERDD